MKSPPPLLLSVFATFAVGGPQVRFAALANHQGRAWRHAIIAMDGRLDCAARLSQALDVSFPAVGVRRGAVFSNLPRFRRALRKLAPDVLLTHNWGSIEWAIANLAPGGVRHIHVEDGFGPEEAREQIRRRVITRRLVLRRSTVVLPSVTLLKVATELWRLPPGSLHYVPNGLDLGRFQPRGAADGDLASDPPPPQVGAVAALRPEKNLARLLRAVRLLRDEGIAFRLAIIGDGPERPGLEALAAKFGMRGVVTFMGGLDDPAEAYRGLDVFALSSDTEQMPLSVLEAMATGLPVAATAVGDVPRMLACENQPFLCPRNDAALADALRRLLHDAALRRRVGAANRAKAERDYDERLMFRRYGQLLAPSPGYGSPPHE
jgi:glycosyltransferase involved in cell wall biosynthesis